MPYYRRVGDVPKQRHTFLRDAAGNRLAEELMGQEGFSSVSSLLYHRHSPSAIVAADPVWPEAGPDELTPNEALLPWHVRATQLAEGGDPVTARRVLFANSAVRIAWTAARQSSELYRNATGDELVYVQSGHAEFDSVFGALEVAPGDYVVIPASTTHRWVLATGDQLNALVLESRGHIGPPARYLSATGQFLEQAPYCERDLRAPSALAESPESSEGVSVLVRHRDGWARHRHAHHRQKADRAPGLHQCRRFELRR